MGRSTVTIKKKMGCTWIELPNAIDMDSYDLIEEEIHTMLSGKNVQVVVDLSNTIDLFSSGLGLIIRLRKRVCELNGCLSLVNVSEKIKGIIKAVNLDKLFPLYSTDVEFEISQEQFQGHLTGKNVGFVFIAHVENGSFRINCSGQMTVEQDLLPIQNFRRDPRVGRYIFDLTGLDMIDSTGAAALIKLLKDLHQHGDVSFAYGATPSVAELVNLLGLDEYVTLCTDERSALANVKKLLKTG
jgi:anti-anti-sigma factor